MVTAVKTWVRCSVSCPGGGTWPFNIQDDGLDYNYNHYENAQMDLDVQNSIDGLDYGGLFNNYDYVIYDALLGVGGPLDCV